jgi:formylglycine-generating enzyme required for sulfatase activity
MSEDIQAAIRKGAAAVTIDAGGVEFELVRIPAGEFTMGSPVSEPGHADNEEPARVVTISKPFYLARFQISCRQYRKVMGVASAHDDTVAMSQINYTDAKEFVRRVSSVAQIDVRLPTEAQWEYACRAGTRTPYYSGSTEPDLARAGWYSANSGGHPHPVGQKEPNAWGLYDMHGNVWEYCDDFIDDYATMPGTDPVGNISERYGAMRGGGWMYGPSYCRAATRLVSDDMFGGAGFRIAMHIS